MPEFSSHQQYDSGWMPYFSSHLSPIASSQLSSHPVRVNIAGYVVHDMNNNQLQLDQQSLALFSTGKGFDQLCNLCHQTVLI
jgi:hypothetical protein